MTTSGRSSVAKPTLLFTRALAGLHSPVRVTERQVPGARVA